MTPFQEQIFVCLCILARYPCRPNMHILLLLLLCIHVVPHMIFSALSSYHLHFLSASVCVRMQCICIECDYGCKYTLGRGVFRYIWTYKFSADKTRNTQSFRAYDGKFPAHTKKKTVVSNRKMRYVILLTFKNVYRTNFNGCFFSDSLEFSMGSFNN